MSLKQKPDTVLCKYHYNSLDQLVASHSPLQLPVQRFYEKVRLVSEVQGHRQLRVIQCADQLLAQQQRQGVVGETTLLGTDPQRSILHAKTASRHHQKAYTVYGHCPADKDSSSFLGFNGERPDPLTGHYLLGNGYRAYNPVLMRFNSPDSWSPFGQGGLNAYTYCLGDPVNRQDPTGHDATNIATIGLAALAVLAAVAGFFPSFGFRAARANRKSKGATQESVSRLIAAPVAAIGAGVTLARVSVSASNPQSPALPWLFAVGSIASAVGLGAGISAVIGHQRNRIAARREAWESRANYQQLAFVNGYRNPQNRLAPAEANTYHHVRLRPEPLYISRAELGLPQSTTHALRAPSKATYDALTAYKSLPLEEQDLFKRALDIRESTV
ncbi:RHS repeat-associated core domain-containing protein [Pseudomonas fontis]|uniref:RHS repeat-associated core domain-containing protein n=1 Tax=Pseudomonas fontis TaxID=2942633 RepID=A0ABT5P000_9PSED|nr:RHS repeat-associated core domain-containing protein [Pseudomonas fontis]MDD0977613.1 RHS repeat-associated core domain-containing protein [Pseudomonas fontis]MDD0993781.1 RHS repeat-associated core domain-containing protein [Pseudomonas fontis]